MVSKQIKWRRVVEVKVVIALRIGANSRNIVIGGEVEWRPLGS